MSKFPGLHLVDQPLPERNLVNLLPLQTMHAGRENFSQALVFSLTMSTLTSSRVDVYLDGLF